MSSELGHSRKHVASADLGGPVRDREAADAVAKTERETRYGEHGAPDASGCLMGNDARAFELIRATILRRLLHKPEMGWQQTLNALGGCGRHLALLAVGMPTLHLWASLIPDSTGEGSALPIPPGWTAPLASDAAPSVWSCLVLIWVRFVVTDVALLGDRVGGFRGLVCQDDLGWIVQARQRAKTQNMRRAT